MRLAWRQPIRRKRPAILDGCGRLAESESEIEEVIVVVN
jgi:hypothetical protein